MKIQNNRTCYYEGCDSPAVCHIAFGTHLDFGETTQRGQIMIPQQRHGNVCESHLNHMKSVNLDLVEAELGTCSDC